MGENLRCKATAKMIFKTKKTKACKMGKLRIYCKISVMLLFFKKKSYLCTQFQNLKTLSFGRYIILACEVSTISTKSTVKVWRIGCGLTYFTVWVVENLTGG